jgi:hypothetical protein
VQHALRKRSEDAERRPYREIAAGEQHHRKVAFGDGAAALSGGVEQHKGATDGSIIAVIITAHMTKAVKNSAAPHPARCGIAIDAIRDMSVGTAINSV